MMNWDKKNFKVENNGNYDNFYGLWKNICEEFILDKINIMPINETNELNENFLKDNKEINDQISEYFKKKKRLNFSHKNNEHTSNIIYNTNNYLIVMNKQFDYGKAFVVPDKLQPNRYFIGFSYMNGSMHVDVCGMIVYFDSNGNMIKKNILSRIVCSYDYRNVHIGTNNSVLYNQTLLFYQVHRDTKELGLFINLLNWEDDVLIKNNNFINTYIFRNSSFFDTKNNIVNENFNLHPRFFCIEKIRLNKKKDIHSTNDEILLIDLGSLKLSEDVIEKNIFDFDFYKKTIPKKYLSIDYYILKSLNDIQEFILESTKFIEENYSDGYPTHCVKCHEQTKHGIYNKKNMICGLGKSYCSNCQIRYSESENNWLCCKLLNGVDNDPNGGDYTYICSFELNKLKNYECSNDSNHSLKYELGITNSEKYHKYPFKEKVNLQHTIIN